MTRQHKRDLKAICSSGWNWWFGFYKLAGFTPDMPQAEENKAGEPVSCRCSCHVQAALFAAEKPAVQPDLFNPTKDSKSASKLSLIGSNA